jgi:capsular polysaccharide biosynthesis protein
MYEASIRILVGQEQGSSASGNLAGDIQGLQQLTQTMTEAVNSRPIAEAVIQQHDLQVTPEDFLTDSMSARQVAATQFIEVNYRDSSPQRAQQVANTIGEVFSEDVSNITPTTNAVTARVWEPAEVPDKPVSPNLPLNVSLALMVGLLLGLIMSLLLDYLDDRWRSPQEVEQITGVPTFGVIPQMETKT